MAMLVNTNAALKTVKGKRKQLFILQSQVNVDLFIFVPLLFSFSVVLFKLSPFFNCAPYFYVQVLLKLILSSRISRLPTTRRFSSFAL